MDQDRRWRWQRLTTERAVIAESRAGYKEYEGCVADAKDEGYVFLPPQAKLVRTNPR